MSPLFRIITIFLVGLAGFFPYMPLVHSDEVFPSSSHHCHGEVDDTSDPTSHDMGSCIDIITDISFSSILSSLDFQDDISEDLLVSPFWQQDHAHIPYLVRKISSHHSLDPPYFTSHSLVGIIKLTI